jgi:HTH-type transcriptional repressor of NAD biosynthesis genes
MKRGLVIGKFMPVHAGHIALIRFAAEHCDELIVSMSYTENDPIDFNLRFAWIREIFKDSSKIKPALLTDDFDDESAPISVRTKIWAAALRKIYPPIDIIFSSEEYGEPFALSMRASHIAFDPTRRIHPVSATLIRQHPFQYWDFIPTIVRPYFVKKICMYGPESTGKSTMARKMAERYHTEFVPEVAREMLTSNNFALDKIIEIGEAQTQRILEKVQIANRILFCDTDLITTQIYSQYYLHQVPDILYGLENKVKYDHYFLFDIDVPWIADGLRDLGDKRDYMYEIFRSELDKRKIPYTKVQGTSVQREQIIISWMHQQFSLK